MLAKIDILTSQTYDLSSAACLFSQLLICHVLASLSLLCCYNKLRNMHQLEALGQHYYYDDQVTDSQGWTSHITHWLGCENNVYFDQNSTTHLCWSPVCHNKQGQEIR